jgi:hypothetical protein
LRAVGLAKVTALKGRVIEEIGESAGHIMERNFSRALNHEKMMGFSL